MTSGNDLGARRSAPSVSCREERNMADLRQVTYCGLYCGLCSSCNRTPRQAREMRDALRKEGMEHRGADLSDFKEFWRFLNGLAESESRCSCREGTCGPPFCTVRKCAPGKSVDACPFCDEYPCRRIRGLAKGYVTMLADGKRMRREGWTPGFGNRRSEKEPALPTLTSVVTHMTCRTSRRNFQPALGHCASTLRGCASSLCPAVGDNDRQSP